MDSSNNPLAGGQAWFYWPPIWVTISAIAICISTGVMVWEGNAATHHASVTVAPNERGSITKPEIEPG